MPIKHVSVKPKDYDCSADRYDAIYGEHPEIDDEIIAKILRKNKAKTVLDLSCGTGQQVVYLLQSGFDITGVDINRKMLSVARKKVKTKNLKCQLSLGDMRSTQKGQFDAVITIFNAIGHLTKSDFTKALKNIGTNLKSGGIYIFDIFNLNNMLTGSNITNLTVDQMATERTRRIRKIQYSTVTKKEGVLASHTTSIVEQLKTGEIKETKGSNTLQIYNIEQLKDLFEKTGFRLFNKYDIKGTRFSDKKTKHMLIVAKKQK